MIYVVNSLFLHPLLTTSLIISAFISYFLNVNVELWKKENGPEKNLLSHKNIFHCIIDINKGLSVKEKQ